MFELSESVVEKILFAMENQNEESALIADSSTASIIPFSELNPDINPEDVYSLPKWFSSDGFNILSEFAESFSAIPVQSELKKVLANGRGVFKNFKKVLKNHPDVEQKFHQFKKRKMMERISEWYVSLREGWGFETVKDSKVASPELFFDTLGDSDVFCDFTFRKFNFLTDKDCVFLESEKIADELKEEYSGDVGILFADLWNEKQNQNKTGSTEKIGGFVCRTLSEELAGCALFIVDSQCPTVARESFVTLTTCFVKKEFRGLGIARKMIANCISDLRDRGFSTFFIADLLIPKPFEKVLTDLGFEKIRSAFVARFI